VIDVIRSARASEVTVVSHHAADCRGVALVQQQFQLLLAAVHVGDLQLRRELVALVRNFALGLRLLSLEPGELLLGIDAAGAHLRQPLARRLDLQVRLFQLTRQRVAALCVRVDLLADRLDAGPYLPELGFLGVDARGAGLKTDRAQQQYISRGRGERACGTSSAHALYCAAFWAAFRREPADFRRQVAYSVQ
jgi:hypothetical protein